MGRYLFVILLAGALLSACSFPEIPLECDATKETLCEDGSACISQAKGNGICSPSCQLGKGCPSLDQAGALAGAIGSSGPTKGFHCLYLSSVIATAPGATAYTFAGLACAPSSGTLSDGTACTALAACAEGYECDVLASRTCKRLCRMGMNDCSSGATCMNAFKAAAFVAGSVGLCE